MDGESFSQYLNAKNKLRAPSPTKKSLKVQQKPISTLVKNEIWTQSIKQMETQLLQDGNVSIPHLGSFWVQRHEAELPGEGKTVSYSINFLIEENISSHIYKMKQSTIGKSLVETIALDTRRIAIDLGTVTKERVRLFMRDFAQQLSLEIKKLNVSSQLSIPFLDFGKLTFTATNYSIRWDKGFLTKVKDSFKEKKSVKKEVNKQEVESNTPQNVTINGFSSITNNEISNLANEEKSNEENALSTSRLDEQSTVESRSLLLPSLTRDDELEEKEAYKAKKDLHAKWKIQMQEKEDQIKRERDSDIRHRELIETVAEIYSESEKRKLEEKRNREKKTMSDNLQIAQLMKNIKERSGNVVECGDIFEKRRVEHPVFSRDQLKEDLEKQIIDKQQKILDEKNQQLEKEREEFEQLNELNKSFKNEMHSIQNQKIKHQKELLEQQIKDKEKQAIIMFDEERRREEAEQVMVPGHDEEIAKNSKKLAKDLLNQALNDVNRKKEEQKKRQEDDINFAKAQAEFLLQQDALLKEESENKKKETQKEMKRFWDTQVGTAQWKNPVK